MILTVPQLIADFAEPWAKLYGHSKTLATIVGFLHVAPIIVGGGLAIALDRSTLRVRRDEPGARARHLAELGAGHGVVLGALALSLISGVALLAADLETYFDSRIFWIKMGLIALLLANGALMTRTERSLRVAGATGDVQWRRLRAIAFTSLALWLTITLAGVALMNLA
jgi:uncharacterized membrane protein